MSFRNLLIAAALAASVAAPGFAQGVATPRIDQREANQQKRIANGISSGSLTAREAARLERQQAHIQAAETRAKSDGVVTRQERRRLTRMQDRASKNIFDKKHNARTAS